MSGIGDPGGRPPSERPETIEDERTLSDLLRLELGPGADVACPWVLGRLDVGDPDVRLAAWRIAETSMLYRCGATSVYQLWDACARSGRALTSSERRRLDPFLS